MEKTRRKRLKQLSRSELLEVMLALKRENDIVAMENMQLRTIKHKLENELQDISGALQRIEQNVYNAELPREYPAEIERGVVWVDYDAFESVYEKTHAKTSEHSSEPSFESVFDSYANEVTNR